MASEENLKEFDTFVRQEMLFNQQKFTDDEDENLYEALLALILLWVKQNKTLKFIKKKINQAKISKNLLKNLTKGIEIQAKILLGKTKKIDQNKIIYEGLNIKEIIKRHKNNVQNSAIRFANNLNNIKESEYQQYFERELKSYKKSTEAIYRTVSSVERNGFEAEIDKKEINRDGISGWTSIAVLDRRTSAICAGLHGKFYSYKEYKSRGNIPNPPPRHSRCRSVLYRVSNGENPKNYIKETLTSFLKRNPEIAVEIMGKNKYLLFKNNKIKANSFVDITGGRFLTNEEIINKFKIKTKKQLKNVKNLKQSKIKYKETINNLLINNK